MGRGCLQGEHILRFEVETYGCSTSTTTSMSCDVPINLLTLVPVSVHLSDPVSESESKSPLLVTDTQLASSFNSIVSMKLMESNGIASSSNASSSDSSNVIGIDMEKNRRNINATRIIPLGQMIIHEQSSVLTLKEHLLSFWDSFKSENLLPDKPLSAHHIRIRDGKVDNFILCS